MAISLLESLWVKQAPPIQFSWMTENTHRSPTRIYLLTFISVWRGLTHVLQVLRNSSNEKIGFHNTHLHCHSRLNLFVYSQCNGQVVWLKNGSMEWFDRTISCTGYPKKRHKFVPLFCLNCVRHRRTKLDVMVNFIIRYAPQANAVWIFVRLINWTCLFEIPHKYVAIG